MRSPLQLGQLAGLLGLYTAVLLSSAVVGRLRHFDDTANLEDGLALGDQLLGGLELVDDLLRRVPGLFHGEVHDPVWPDEESHSPWIDFRCPRQIDDRADIAAGFLQVERIEPGHDSYRQFTHRHRSVVERGSPQTQ
jgi:hypothetical protein